MRAKSAILLVAVCVTTLLWLTPVLLEAQANDSEEVLLQKLRSPDAATRRSAGEALAQMPHEDLARILPDLLPALKDSEPDVRFCVAVTLHAAAHTNETNATTLSKAVPALTEALRDKDSRVRETAASAIGSVMPRPPAEVAAPLVKLLRDPEPRVRRVALGALAAVGNVTPEIVPAVLKVFTEDKAPGMRGWAASVFGEFRISDSVVIDALIQALGDREKFVRQQSIRALGSIGPPASPAIPELEKIAASPKEDQSTRQYAEYALRSIKAAS